MLDELELEQKKNALPGELCVSTQERRAMEERLAACRPLLAEDGAIFVEIDDNELAHLQLSMDAIFGRENRASTVTIVRSASIW